MIESRGRHCRASVDWDTFHWRPRVSPQDTNTITSVIYKKRRKIQPEASPQSLNWPPLWHLHCAVKWFSAKHPWNQRQEVKWETVPQCLCCSVYSLRGEATRRRPFAARSGVTVKLWLHSVIQRRHCRLSPFGFSFGVRMQGSDSHLEAFLVISSLSHE